MTVRSPERKRDNSPSPVSYPEKDKNWVTLSHKQKIPQYTIQKEKTNTFLDQMVR